jgi:hypothetical protein
MIIKLTAAARVVPLTALMLGACVSQSAYEKQGAELQQARAQVAAEQSQITTMQQEQKWVSAQTCLPVSASTSCAVTRMRSAALRTLPSRT